jgi:UDP:flavonoid glycosyltransferase YjiC (YdhE family)
MNLLSMSCTNGVHSHLVPLFVLNQRYFRRMEGICNHFLLPAHLHSKYVQGGISVLPIDFSPFDGEDLAQISREDPQHQMQQRYAQYTSKIEEAFRLSQPEVVIEDNELLSTLIATRQGIPRISIFRTGLFRSIEKHKRNPAHMHSMEKTGMGRGLDASLILHPQKKISQLYRKFLKTTYLRDDVDCFMDYLNARTKLIPGIPSIEVLPGDIPDRESYFYTGPLLVEDNPSDKLTAELDAFFYRNRSRKTVFITTGMVDQDNIQDILQCLLSKGYAIVSTRNLADPGKAGEQFFHNGFVSLNYICDKVDLVIHQCGSGMYHYPLLHRKPAITLGTQCYDREDVALRLQERELSRHVPSANDDRNFIRIFEDALLAFEKDQLASSAELGKVRDEIHRTMLDFDMEEVILHTINKLSVFEN